MAGTILPEVINGISVTPEEILRYLNPDGVRQMLRQERLRWLLKPNRDVDADSPSTMFRYTGDLYNEGHWGRHEVRAYTDNGSNPGFAGINMTMGEFPVIHNYDKWDGTLSAKSKDSITPRVTEGVITDHSKHSPRVEKETEAIKVLSTPTGPLTNGVHPEDAGGAKAKRGFGLDSTDQNPTVPLKQDSYHRAAAILYDGYDGRPYVLSNDENAYVNNKFRHPYYKIPGRSVARMIDIPQNIVDLDNTHNHTSDWAYGHTEQSFTGTNKFVLDNIHDMTFVYPEVSQDTAKAWLANLKDSLAGGKGYAEGDGSIAVNTQSSPGVGDANSSFNTGKAWVNNATGPNNPYNTPGFFSMIFRSVEELEKVDVLGQRKTLQTHAATPSGRRMHNFYSNDGIRDYDAYTNEPIKKRIDEKVQAINAMETNAAASQPHPYSAISDQVLPAFKTDTLYQWRYNRVDVFWASKDITIQLVAGGTGYRVGDILRYPFMNKWLFYQVRKVGGVTTGPITEGRYMQPTDTDVPTEMKHHLFERFEFNPSTHGIAVEFRNQTQSGRGATFIIKALPTIVNKPTQIKNNLYAYVDVTPTVPSDNSSPWSDNTLIETGTGNEFVHRSTAPRPGYTGVNQGRGGPNPSAAGLDIPLYEHGGNATAGTAVHLFKYVIDTSGTSTWFDSANNVTVYTGKWVDQGPMGLERAVDIKALYLSNQDTNNFNNYYKFMLDIMIDSFCRDGDVQTILSGTTDIANRNHYSSSFRHITDKDPWTKENLVEVNPSQALYDDYKTKGYTINLLNPSEQMPGDKLPHQAFFNKRIVNVNNSPTPAQNSRVVIDEITDKVDYLNAATGVMFFYNPSMKFDKTYGYGSKAIGWHPVAGTIQQS